MSVGYLALVCMLVSKALFPAATNDFLFGYGTWKIARAMDLHIITIYDHQAQVEMEMLEEV